MADPDGVTAAELRAAVRATMRRDFESSPWPVSQAMVDRYEAGECTCLDPVPWPCQRHET